MNVFSPTHQKGDLILTLLENEGGYLPHSSKRVYPGTAEVWVNPPRSAIFDGFYGFKRSRTFWISKDHNLCVCKAFERHTCSPGSVPAGIGISPVPTGTLPGGPRGPPEAIQTRRLCRVDDLGAWVCPDSTKWSRIALCGALAETRFFRKWVSALQTTPTIRSW